MLSEFFMCAFAEFIISSHTEALSARSMPSAGREEMRSEASEYLAMRTLASENLSDSSGDISPSVKSSALSLNTRQ